MHSEKLVTGFDYDTSGNIITVVSFISVQRFSMVKIDLQNNLNLDIKILNQTKKKIKKTTIWLSVEYF